MALTERIRRIFSAILSPHFLGREQEALVEMAGASLDEAQDMIDEGIGGVQEQIDDLHSEYGAGLIGIEDQDDNFTSTNVEGALKELAERDISEEDVDVTGNWSFHNPITLVDSPYGGSLGASLTDDRAYTLPDASGTIALLDDIPPQVNLIAGSNINIGGTYPDLTISSAGSGPGGGVASVNGQVGDVVLTYSDVGAAPASHAHPISQVTGLQSALDGKANTSHTHAAADITSGIIARARLGTGTADSDTYLRGDGTWATPDTGTGGGGGTVTRVQVASSGTGLSFTGGPITTTGTITGTLSTNLQGWSGIAPSSKINSSVTLTAGTGLNGGGDLSANRTFSIDPSVVGRIDAAGYAPTGDYDTFPIGSRGYTVSSDPNSPGTNLYLETLGGFGSGDNRQLAWPHRGNGQFRFRCQTGGVYGPWKEVWTSDSFNPASFASTSRTITAGNGMSGGGTLAADRTLALGTPSSITLSSTNAVQSTSHTHAFTPGGTTAQYIRGNGTLATFPSTMTPTAHTHAAGDITSGTLNSARIPNLNASKITAGTFAAARIPDLSSSYVATSGNQTGIAGNKTFTGTITAANVAATSDARLKEEIEEMKARQDLLSALTYYRYKWKGSGNKAVGILAQEVQSIAPELVFESDDGRLAVDKAGLALEMVFALIDKLEAIDGSSD